jgi:hypothetical protein
MEESRLKQEADAKKASGDTMETDANPGIVFYPTFFELFDSYE